MKKKKQWITARATADLLNISEGRVYRIKDIEFKPPTPQLFELQSVLDYRDSPDRKPGKRRKI